MKVFITINQYMGMVRQWQELLHGGRYAESYTDALPDLVKLAEACQWVGLRAKRPDEVDDVIQEMIEIDRPVIADIWSIRRLFPDDSVGRCTQRDAARPGRRGIKTRL